MKMCKSVCSFPVFRSCGLEKCVHEASCCGIMSWPVSRALFSPADELNLSIGLRWRGRKSGFFFREEGVNPPAPAVGEGTSSALWLIIPNPGGSDSKISAFAVQRWLRCSCSCTSSRAQKPRGS